MTDQPTAPTDTASTEAALLGQTARIAWRDLQRFFAAGRVLVLADSHDLVDVASSIVADDTAAVEPLLDSGALRAVDDDLARLWLQADVTLWCVVIPPWVVVQERRAEQGATGAAP